MSDESKLDGGTDIPSLKGLSFSGSFYPVNFRLPRIASAKTLSPLEGLFRPSSFNLSPTRRAVSDLTSRGKPSINPKSTLTSFHSFDIKLQRHIYDGDTVKPLQTLSYKDLKRLQAQDIGSSSLAEKLHGLTKKISSAPHNSEPNSSRRGRKCLELFQKKRTIAIIVAVLLFLALAAIAVGVGIYFGVTNKSPDKTTAWPNNTNQTSSSTPNETSRYSTLFVNHTNDQSNHSITTTTQHSADEFSSSEERNNTRSTAKVTAIDPSSGHTTYVQTDQATLTTTKALTSTQALTTSQ